ncbi:MAG: hypothetical protein D6794_11540 [Deltaproteobacteria bacterium]|nr:MAG: hypothetical protein D6794_11540 [Deltaproteobacteria bacterium]
MEPSRPIGTFGSVLLAHLVLVLHGLVLLGLAFLVLFFRGVLEYLPWIVAGGVALMLLSAWYFWRVLRRQGRSLSRVLDHPLIRERGVEVRLLGGMASFRLGVPGVKEMEPRRDLALAGTELPALPERDDEAGRLRALARLVKLREAGELDEESFQLLRRELLGVADSSCSSR